MNSLTEIVKSMGVLLRREALALGFDDQTLRRAVRGKELVRIRQGAYADAASWSAADEAQRHLLRARAVVRTAQCQGAFSHTTAALVHGIDVWDLSLRDVHVTRVDRKGGRREAGIAQHRGLLSPAEIVEIDGLKCTDPVRTVMDLTTITDVEHALVTTSSALNKGLCGAEELSDAAASWLHVPGSLTTGLVLRLADERFASVGESRTFHLCWQQGIPLPVPQLEVRDHATGFLAQLDFAWPELGVWLEFDGIGKYVQYLRPGESSSDAVVREKKREDHIRRLTGWICVRITWADLSRPEIVAQRLRDAFAQQSKSA